MKTLRYILPLAIIVLATTVYSCKKSSSTVTTTTGPYFPKVKTIIQGNCLSCHSSSGSWAGRPTAFDNDSSIAALSASIKAAVADPATLANKRMPQGGELSAGDIRTIVSWYNLGGKTTD